MATMETPPVFSPPPLLCRASLVHKGSEIRIVTLVVGQYILILKTVRPAPAPQVTRNAAPVRGLRPELVATDRTGACTPA